MRNEWARLSQRPRVLAWKIGFFRARFFRAPHFKRASPPKLRPRWPSPTPMRWSHTSGCTPSRCAGIQTCKFSSRASPSPNAALAFFRRFFLENNVIPTSTPRRFWGPNGLGQLPYFSKELGDSTTAGGFFARMVGLGFMIMFLGTIQTPRLDRRALSRNVPRNKTHRTRPVSSLPQARPASASPMTRG